MKVEVQFLGSSIDVDTYEGERVEWTIHDGQLSIYVGTKDDTDRKASYPESRVVRIRVIEPA
jgi:hypothetical protein